MKHFWLANSSLAAALMRFLCMHGKWLMDDNKLEKVDMVKVKLHDANYFTFLQRNHHRPTIICWFGWFLQCLLALHSMVYVLPFVFSCDQTALQMVFSVCLSVRPSVCLSYLFDYVPIIVSSWNFQEVLPMTKVRSMQKVKVRGQRLRSQRSQPNLTVSGL